MTVPSDDGARPLVVFLNEVAGGRMLLSAVRERAEAASYIAVVAPQNQPSAGQITDFDQVREAARSRVDVTLAIFDEFGIEAIGEVMDHHPDLALGDAIRAHRPSELLISSLPENRFGFTRRDLVQWAKGVFEPETPITHIPVRIENDSIRLDVTHTLVVATQTLESDDLLNRLREKADAQPHRYTIISPRSEDASPARVRRDLARVMAELYRDDVDVTGQPMSPDPFDAVRNAIDHYRVDDVLISTFAGETSRWLEGDLVGRVREITDKPVEHIEAGRPAEAVATAVAAGAPGASGADGSGGEEA